jgi:hypothetical protein
MPTLSKVFITSSFFSSTMTSANLASLSCPSFINLFYLIVLLIPLQLNYEENLFFVLKNYIFLDAFSAQLPMYTPNYFKETSSLNQYFGFIFTSDAPFEHIFLIFFLTISFTFIYSEFVWEMGLI